MHVVGQLGDAISQWRASSAQSLADINALKAELATTKQINVLLKSWRDRFGPLPPPADNLLRSTELRIAAQHAGIATVEILNSKLMLTRNGDYILLGNKFPRLRSPDPASRLREAVDMVKKI